ncbi:MAG TPA: hypothetical protein VJH95_06175 [Candidatus Nanoarchaeia archaeon]|nr:hypothetical protein [Candidatus Nanoarchaeia archaeon]
MSLTSTIGGSVFLKTFGDNPLNKVLDFLIVFDAFDYSIADIAKNSEVGYATLKLLIKEMVKRKLVVATRVSGRNKMYKLNKNNPVVASFVDFYWNITNKQAEELVKPVIA